MRTTAGTLFRLGGITIAILYTVQFFFSSAALFESLQQPYFLSEVKEACASAANSLSSAALPPAANSSSSSSAALPPRRGPSVFFGIKSGTGTKEYGRRMRWRNSTCAQYYADHDVSYRFMIGRPYEKGHDLTGHNQGAWDTDTERQDAGDLIAEEKLYKDMAMLPMRDAYMSLPDKTWLTLEYIWSNQPDNDYVGLHDVEFCVNLTIASKVIDKFEKEDKAEFDFLYTGNYHHAGTEYESMKGPEGIPRPYLSGWIYFLSRRLVQYIVVEDRAHSVQHGVYSSVSEDVAVGKWVAYADETHNVSTKINSHTMFIEIDHLTYGTMDATE